jgi:hypothetical protein
MGSISVLGGGYEDTSCPPGPLGSVQGGGAIVTLLRAQHTPSTCRRKLNPFPQNCGSNIKQDDGRGPSRTSLAVQLLSNCCPTAVQLLSPLNNPLFCNVTPCSSFKAYGSFDGKCSLHLQGGRIRVTRNQHGGGGTVRFPA